MATNGEFVADNPNPTVYSSSASGATPSSKDLTSLSLATFLNLLNEASSGQGSADDGHRATTVGSVSGDSSTAPYDDFDDEEVFELLRHLNDPEHPHTLEQLRVVQMDHIKVDNDEQHISVQFTPTIPHCSQAMLIGLMLRVKLLRCVPDRFKVDVSIFPGSHNTEDAINKQLNDKGNPLI